MKSCRPRRNSSSGANEELHTVNEEMQHRNELLTQLNNDLTNLLNRVNLPMVMVGADLSVRRFTPQATNMLGLMASDVGRSIPRLQLKIDVANLEQMTIVPSELRRFANCRIIPGTAWAALPGSHRASDGVDGRHGL